MSYTVGILLAGTPGASLYENGLPVASMLEQAGFCIALMEPADPNQEKTEEKLKYLADQMHLDLIVTMSSLKPEDVMPAAAGAVCSPRVPDIGEAMLSGEIAGVRGKTLILNLPGKAQAAKEALQPVLPALAHALSVLKQDT